MMKSLTLLSLTLIGFFWASEPEDNEKEVKLFDLPMECLENIHSFHEKFLSGPTCLSCYQMSYVGHVFDKIIGINQMIEKCLLDHSENVYNYFSYLPDKDRDELHKDLEDWKKLLNKDGHLYYKYREALPPEGSDDYEKLELLENYREMYKRMFARHDYFYEIQVGLLKKCGVDFRPSDTESNSTRFLKAPHKDQPVRINELGVSEYEYRLNQLCCSMPMLLRDLSSGSN